MKDIVIYGDSSFSERMAFFVTFEQQGNIVAYMSYIVTSVSLALSCWSAVKIKDKLIEKKEKEQDELNKLMQNA